MRGFILLRNDSTLTFANLLQFFLINRKKNINAVEEFTSF